MNYGFVIDTRSCIGCHACSVACKSENQVPLGVSRTWVKYTESGTYPNTRRDFQVTRCNHCSNPPCVRICPVSAMVQRKDGIVEFDSEVCIGCKACLQACPYDAIYIDPETKTAAKCHFCAHRVEQNLEPSCVVVCPTHAIIAGDLDDPHSEISQVLGRSPVTVRKPEQGTAPKLFYVAGADTGLHPTAAERAPAAMMSSEVQPLHGPRAPAYRGPDAPRPTPERPQYTPRTSTWGAAVRTPGTQGDPQGGPIQITPGRAAEQMVQVGYTAQHRVPWHWQVPAYLVTKGLGAGVFLLLAVGALSGWFPVSGAPLLGGGLLGLLGLLATTALLVFDLEHPARFLRILLRPQWKSWLTRGAFILMAFSAVAGLWWAAELASWAGLLHLPPAARAALAALTLPLAVGGATYTAWLFAQCEGRDLWQSPLLPLHLLLQALMMGAGGLLCLGLVAWLPAAPALRLIFAVALGLDLFAILAGELGVPHASEQAARAAREISRGRYRTQLWGGAVALGHLAPLALLALPGALPAALAALAAGVGLYAYEHAFVMAPQELPNS